jgi:hypothetical protein
MAGMHMNTVGPPNIPHPDAQRYSDCLFIQASREKESASGIFSKNVQVVLDFRT